jgi:hypothetical protein
VTPLAAGLALQPRGEGTLVVSTQQLVRGPQGKLIYELDGTSAGEPIRLSFMTVEGWVLKDQVGQTLSLLRHAFRSECSGSSGPRGLDEPMRFAQASLRDSRGALLFLDAGSAPLLEGGRVDGPTDIVPEFSFGWEESACEPTAGGSRTVLMTLRPAGAAGAVLGALPGEPVHFTAAGMPYTWVVSRAWRMGGAGCGNAAWIVFRDDFLYQVR